VDLAADEGEAGAELEHEALEVIDERLLDLALAARIGGPEEVEQVGVLEDLHRHVGLCGRQGLREVADRLAGACVRAVVDLQGEDIARPAVHERLPGIPEAVLRVIEPLEERDVVVPGQLCKRRLHN